MGVLAVIQVVRGFLGTSVLTLSVEFVGGATACDSSAAKFEN